MISSKPECVRACVPLGVQAADCEGCTALIAEFRTRARADHLLNTLISEQQHGMDIAVLSLWDTGTAMCAGAMHRMACIAGVFWPLPGSRHFKLGHLCRGSEISVDNVSPSWHALFSRAND